MRQTGNYVLRIIEQNGGSEMELSEDIKNEIVAVAERMPNITRDRIGLEKNGQLAFA